MLRLDRGICKWEPSARSCEALTNFGGTSLLVVQAAAAAETAGLEDHPNLCRRARWKPQKGKKAPAGPKEPHI